MKRGNFAPWVTFAVLLVGAWLATDGFFEFEMRAGQLTGAFVDVLRRGAPVAILALGMAPVIATGGVDLSVGAVMALASSSAAYLVVEQGFGPLTVVALALANGALLGAFSGALVAWARIPPILATLVLLSAGRGIATLFSGAGIQAFDSSLVAWLGRGVLLGLPVPLYLVAGVLVFVVAIMRATTFGLHVEALGDNGRAAERAGVSRTRTLLRVYALSGTCAALAGLVVAGDVGAADASRIGQYQELDAVLAVVLGGAVLTGGRALVLGAVAGAYSNQLLATVLLHAGLAAPLILVAKAAIVLVLVVARSPRWLEARMLRAARSSP